MSVSCFFVCMGRSGWNGLVETPLDVWQRFVAKIPRWSLIREPAISTETFTQSISAVECTDHATPSHDMSIIIIYKYYDILICYSDLVLGTHLINVLLYT